jgi:flavin-binding protein dodecin
VLPENVVKFKNDTIDHLKLKGSRMSKVVKVIEVLAQSEKSWEDAAASAVKAASKSIKAIKSINIVNMSAKVEGDKIVKYRINAKISFLIK